MWFRKKWQLIFVFLFFIISCNKNNTEQPVSIADDVIEVEIDEAKGSDFDSVKWSNEEGIVFVIFGYEYNDKDFFLEAKKLLAQKFGLAENGGLVQCIKFPEDLHNRISNFRSIADSNHIRGIVVLGAPEGTHWTFANIRDERDNKPNFNIFSFFPQDDILGQEGTCSFVLDHEATESMKLEEHGHSMDKDILDIIVSAVRYAAILPGELPSDNELHAHVQAIVGKRKVHRFVDGESGIQSRNHFVVEATE